MEWTIQDLGALGELIGALGVIITLVYLAYQIRQNTVQLEQNLRMARAAAVNASNITLRENRQSIFESSDMAEIFLIGNRSPQELGEVQILRYRLVMQNVVEAMLDIYTQTSVTNFSPETWETQGVSLAERVLGTDGGRWFWSQFADNYPTGFRHEVDGILLNLSGGERDDR